MNGARFVASDIQCDGNLLHVVDKVLFEEILEDLASEYVTKTDQSDRPYQTRYTLWSTGI